jgi:riboflavin-specific deaminase-like protein
VDTEHHETETLSEGEAWDGILALKGASGATWTDARPLSPGAALLVELLVPLLAAAKRAPGAYVFAHLAQSLDGRIATPEGASQWISGDADIVHTHRLRALADAVVVGAETVRRDNPRLTVRRVAGANPLRVVIDAERRLGNDFAVFADGAAETVLACAEEHAAHGPIGAAQALGVARRGDGLCVDALLAELARRGARRVFVEGGGVTVSRFLDAGRLDRLHLTVAPLIMGAGRPGIALSGAPPLADALRPATRTFRIGECVLFESVFYE